MKTLITKRLILRSPKKTDVFAMHLYAKDKRVGPNAGWPPHKNLRETAQFMNLLIEDDDVWAITKDDVLIGTLNLNLVTERYYNPKLMEIGFALNPKFWNQGIVTEAVARVIKYAFEELEIKKLITKHYIDNESSKAVINKFAFKKDKIIFEDDYRGNKREIVTYYMKLKDYKRSNLYE